MNESSKPSVRSRVGRLALNALLCVAAAAAGIYVGLEIVGKRPKPIRTAVAPPTFSVGEPFPPESCLDAMGATLSFYDLLDHRQLVLLFVESPSETSEHLQVYWRDRIARRLSKSEWQVVMCRDMFGDTVSAEPLEGVADRVVQYDLPYFREAYLMYAMPVVVELDSSGTITFVQQGFDQQAGDNIESHFLSDSD